MSDTLSEEDLVRGFEEGSLGEFPHAAHVRLTLIYLRRHGRDEALQRLTDGLRNFVAHKGVPEKFHLTMTQAWLELVESARRMHPALIEPKALFEACPELLEKNALRRFYSPERLASEAARTGWLLTDLAPIDARALREMEQSSGA